MGRNHRKGLENHTLTSAAATGARPEAGAVYTFIPEAFTGETRGHLPGRQEIPRRVTGRVTYINEAHRWFRVEYEIHGYHLSECFKF